MLKNLIINLNKSNLINNNNNFNKQQFIINANRYFSNKMSNNSNSVVDDRSKLFVSPKWLNDNQNNVKIVDASWFMAHEKRDPRKEFVGKHIKNAKLFDIDEICDKTVSLPHNLPSSEVFEKEMKRLGISNDDHVIIYDTRAQYVASARVWWTFLIFGHQSNKVSLLEGGLPAWEREGFTTVSSEIENNKDDSINYKSNFNSSLVKNKQEMLNNLDSKEYQIIDARSGDRFWGRVDEPRPGLLRGHIPGSLNIPWTDLIAPVNENGGVGGFIAKDKLLTTFKDKGVDLSSKIATTCGSGTTAAVLTLGLYELGYPLAPIYDGSWSEWGQPLNKLPTSCSGN